DADTLDALSAIWLYQATDPNDAAVADVDDLLTLRGLVRNPGGQGRRGGYKAHQRMRMGQSLAHIQNLWLTMAALETYDGDDARPGKHRRKPITRAIQSRASIMASATLCSSRWTRRRRRQFHCVQNRRKHRARLLTEKALRCRGTVRPGEEKVVNG